MIAYFLIKKEAFTAWLYLHASRESRSGIYFNDWNLVSTVQNLINSFILGISNWIAGRWWARVFPSFLYNWTTFANQQSCVCVCVYLNTARKEIYVDTMSDHTRPTSTCSRLFLNLSKDTDILWLLLVFTAREKENTSLVYYTFVSSTNFGIDKIFIPSSNSSPRVSSNFLISLSLFLISA